MQPKWVMFMLGVLCVCAAVWTGAAASESGAGSPAGAAPSAQDIVGWLPIGAQSPREDRRRIHPTVQRYGWRGFVERVVASQIQWGVRRFMIHNPFGTLASDQMMQLDQYLDAKRDGHAWAYQDFVEAWRPVTRGDYGEPIQVICYLGAPLYTAEFVKLYEEGRIDAWMNRAWASVELPLAAGMDLAFDASARVEADHPFFQFAAALRQRGVRVYLEGLPGADAPHTWDFNFVVTERFVWYLQDTFGALRPSELTGEIMCLMNRIPRSVDSKQRGWETPFYARVLRSGYTLGARIDPLMRQGIGMQEIMREAALPGPLAPEPASQSNASQ